MDVPTLKGAAMRVLQILTNKGSEIFAITPEASVAELVRTLADRKVGALLVRTPKGQIAGIVSERDIVRALGSRETVLQDPVSSIMTTDVVTVSHDADVSDLMRLMTDQRVRHVPVVDEGNELVGVVSIGDVVKNRMDELEAERSALMDYITQGG
jgi:CBS domain-containing protein